MPEFPVVRSETSKRRTSTAAFLAELTEPESVVCVVLGEGRGVFGRRGGLDEAALAFSGLSQTRVTPDHLRVFIAFHRTHRRGAGRENTVFR